MNERLIRRLPRHREPKNKSARRYRVDYDLAYDGGGSRWSGFYRTRLGAAIALRWNLHVASWGGNAWLYDQRPELDEGID